MKEEYKTRIEACEERQREFERRQSDMKEQVTKFEKFIQENDSKRQRAEMKARQEEKQKHQKDEELGGCRASTTRRSASATTSSRSSRRCASTTSTWSARSRRARSATTRRFGKPINRHKTLINANRDLMDTVRVGDGEMDDLRTELMNLQLDIQGRGRRDARRGPDPRAAAAAAEAARRGRKHSDDKETKEERVKDVNRETGQVCSTIRNIKSFARADGQQEQRRPELEPEPRAPTPPCAAAAARARALRSRHHGPELLARPQVRRDDARRAARPGARAREGEDLQSRHEHVGDVGIGDWSKAADRWPSQPSASPSRGGAGGRRGAPRCRRPSAGVTRRARAVGGGGHSGSPRPVRAVRAATARATRPREAPPRRRREGPAQPADEAADARVAPDDDVVGALLPRRRVLAAAVSSAESSPLLLGPAEQAEAQRQDQPLLQLDVLEQVRHRRAASPKVSSAFADETRAAGDERRRRRRPRDAQQSRSQQRIAAHRANARKIRAQGTTTAAPCRCSRRTTHHKSGKAKQTRTSPAAGTGTPGRGADEHSSSAASKRRALRDTPTPKARGEEAWFDRRFEVFDRHLAALRWLEIVTE